MLRAKPCWPGTGRPRERRQSFRNGFNADLNGGSCGDTPQRLQACLFATTGGRVLAQHFVENIIGDCSYWYLGKALQPFW
jgi:hypothetical protein